MDQTKDINDPFHIIVWMPTPQGILITHEPNDTSNEEDFDKKYAIPKLGMGYREYLKSKGVDAETVMPVVPKTEQEIADTEKFGRQNTDLAWFKELGYKDQLRYIGRGHLLSDDQFNFLWGMRGGDHGFDLLSKYVSLGQALPEEQFNILVGKEEEAPAEA